MLEEIHAFAKNPLYLEDSNRNLPYRLIRLLKLLVLAIGLSLLLLMLASAFQALFKFEISKPAIADLFEDNSVRIVFAVAVIAAPLLEEMVFRAPLAWFRNSKYFPILFYLVTSCFGFVHITNFELTAQVWLLSPLLVAPQLGVGLLLGFIRIKFGLLWSMALHASYNCILLLPLIVMKSLDLPFK